MQQCEVREEQVFWCAKRREECGKHFSVWTVAWSVVVVGPVVIKEDASKGSCDQTAKRLGTLRSLLLAVGDERRRNY